MREKYESLALVQLKELAKVRGIKGVSAMKKADVVEAMLAEDEKDKSKETGVGPAESGADRTVEKPAERGTERTVEKPAERENDRTAERGAERTVEKPAERGTDRTVEKPAERGIERTVERPAERGTDRTAERLGDRAERAESPRTEYHRNEGGRPEGTRTAADGEQPVRPVRVNEAYDSTQYPAELDSGIEAQGILEVMPDGYGFIRSDNYLPGSEDVYVAPSQIRRFGLKTGDILRGNKRIKTQQEKFSALLFVRTINGYTPEELKLG